jgi:hypothetical protein
MSDWRREVKKDSPFLYHYDIEGKTPLAVTITACVRVEAYCPGKTKAGPDGKKQAGSLWCLSFKGGKKVLGMNVTNGNLIEHHHGPDHEQWVDKQIILRIAECDGEKCIRVHAPGARLPKQCKPFRYLDADPDKAGTRPAKPGQAAKIEPAGDEPDMSKSAADMGEPLPFNAE